MTAGAIPHAEYLDRRRKQLLAELARLAPEQTSELVSILTAQDHLREQSQASTLPYAGQRRAIDAIVSHLIQAGRPLTVQELDVALTQGGFGPHDKRRSITIRDAAFYHARSSKPRLKRFDDGKIGLPDWTEKD